MIHVTFRRHGEPYSGIAMGMCRNNEQGCSEIAVLVDGDYRITWVPEKNTGNDFYDLRFYVRKDGL